jgi:5-formaminoimidazole-4-carboxamide-1-beta-D-ribofuranosyl 5'-monophosphate synthetase
VKIAQSEVEDAADIQNYAKKNGFRAVFVAADVEDQHALDFYRAAGGVASDVKHFTFQTSF